MSIGIDLGTCTSLVAINKLNKVNILNNDRGLTMTPSFVSYAHPEVVVGSVAKYELVKNLGKVVYDVKRIIGKEFDDPTVAEDIKNWSFDVINKNNLPYIKVDHKGKNLELLPQEVSAEILKYLKKLAEQQLPELEVVVITVPAHFSPSQITATEEAARLAGIKNYKILKEPIAAALAYSENRMKKENHKILIYDFGGGTFDVSIVELRGKTIELIATGGDGHLGGEDITNRIFDHFYEEYKQKRDGEEGNASARAHLRKACDSVKIELSETEDAIVDCNILESYGINGSITRSFFNERISSIIKRTIEIVDHMLKKKNIKKDEIGGIILAGGSSRIPLVKDTLEKEFKDIPVFKTINPDEAIVHGAAFYANLVGKNDPNLPQIIDIVEEIEHPSQIVRENSNRKITPPSISPIFSSRERRENMNCVAIGIDLGTSTSIACKCKEGVVDVIPDSTGHNEVHSCVFYKNENDHMVGITAKSKASSDAKSFIYDIKRIIGRKMNDKVLLDLIKNLNYDVVQDQTYNPIVTFNEKNPKFTKTPEQVSADILGSLKDNIEKKLEGQKYKVVLTVPAHFTDSQRRATQASADLAGLNVLQLINEPTAAAIAYGLTNSFDEIENTIVVYDFGGGTFDVSIIRIKGKNIELLGSGGDNYLGGSDLTGRIYDHILKKYKEKSGNEFINTKGSHHLRKGCEEAKIHLSEFEEVEVDWNMLEKYHIDNKLTRNEFQELTRDLFDRTISILDEVMRNNNINKSSISEIVLVGGSSKIPYVETAIKEFLPGVNISKAINPIEAVAQGASILADDLLRNGENAKIVESTYINSSLTDATSQLVQPPPAPEINSVQLQPPPSYQLQKPPSLQLQSPPPPPPSIPEIVPENRTAKVTINESFIIKEKTSHSYGVLVTDSDTGKRRIDIILKKGSVLPCTEKKHYLTAENWDKTKLSIYEGEDLEIKPENFLHEFIFSNITRTPEGTDIEVEFTIDKNGLLIVKGIDCSDPSNTKEVTVKIK